MWHFATDLKVITSLLYNQKLSPIITLLKSQLISGDGRCLICRWTHLEPWWEWPHTASGLWLSGPASSKPSSSSGFWYTDGLHPVKDLLLSTEGGLKMSLKFLQGKLMLWNRLLLQGKILLSCPWTHGCSKAYNGRFVCILIPILICRDGFTLIVFPQSKTPTVPN